jgi:hypothetical protein
MKKNKSLEELLQKIITSTNPKEKALLVAILKNKWPDAKIPK